MKTDWKKHQLGENKWITQLKHRFLLYLYHQLPFNICVDSVVVRTEMIGRIVKVTLAWSL
jgi:hypothetical protein